MNVDPTGQFGILVGLLIFAVILTLIDVAYIASGKVKATTDKSNGNIHIENSSLIITPWVRWGYSFYLNHFNKDTKDLIKGSTSGVVFEWALHNYAAWLGVGGESTKHVDLGKTLFADGKFHPLIDSNGYVTKTGLMSMGMQLLYVMFGNPFAWISDLFANWGL